MKEYVGIAHKKVSIPDDVYNVLSSMDRTNGLVSKQDIEVLSNSKDIEIKLINTQKMHNKNINIYGLSIDGDENFEIVKTE